MRGTGPSNRSAARSTLDNGTALSLCRANVHHLFYLSDKILPPILAPYSPFSLSIFNLHQRNYDDFPFLLSPSPTRRKENSSARGILLGVPRGVERTAAREESEKALLSLSLTIRFERGQGLIGKKGRERETEICTTMNSEGWS